MKAVVFRYRYAVVLVVYGAVYCCFWSLVGYDILYFFRMDASDKYFWCSAEVVRLGPVKGLSI